MSTGAGASRALGTDVQLQDTMERPALKRLLADIEAELVSSRANERAILADRRLPTDDQNDRDD